MPQKSNKNKNKKKQSKTAKPRPQRDAKPIDKCVLDYADSLLRPWSQSSPCIPLPPGLPSLKQKFFSKGTFGTSSTTGFGFIQCSAYGIVGDHTTINRPVFTSDATYNAYVSSVDGAITGVNGHNTNSPYGHGLFGPNQDQMRGRVVSCGVRIRYTGSELNRGGVAYVLENPDHATLNTSDVSELRTFDHCRSVPIGRQWISVTHQPVREDEYDYANLPGSSSHYLAIFVNAANPTVSAPFEFEYYINCELIGALARGKTQNDVEPEATHKVISKIAAMVNPSSYGITGKDVLDGLGYVIKNYNTASAVTKLARLAIMN